MTDAERDPVTDRRAQLDAAYAAYSTAVQAVRAEQRKQFNRAAEAAAASERALFDQWQRRVEQINGGPWPTDPAPVITDEAERADNDSDNQSDE